MQQAGAQQARRVLTTQAIIGLLTVAFALPFGESLVLSATVGAGACLLANLLFAAWVFQGYRAQAPERLLLRIYAAEIVKIGIILGLFVLAFVTIPDLSIPVLLGSYLAVQMLAPVIAVTWRP